jgi:SAM-dependent methyltransferase
MGSVVDVPADWYRKGFPPRTAAMPWADRTEAEVDRSIAMLRPEGGERILDLACGIGRHSRELRRRGFEVVGVDINPDLLEIAERETSEAGLEVAYMEADLRELELREEFDIVLSLNDGAVGYFETDEENHRTFEVISRALKPGGQNLIQVPNVLYARARLPQRSWIPSESMVELVEHRWNKKNSYMEGAMIPVRFGEVLENLDKRIEFRQRLYTVEELKGIYDSVGMSLERVFHGNGRPKEPTENQFEIFAAARKG